MDALDSQIVSAFIGAAVGVLGTLATLWAKKRSRRWVLRDKKWDDIYSSLESIEELTGQHIRKIGEVVKPLLREEDFLETCQRYAAFVHDERLPKGYASARSTLNAVYGTDEFRGEPIHENLKSVIQQLQDFQNMGFLLKQSSWRIEDAMDNARDLHKILGVDNGQDPEEITKLADLVREQFQKAVKDIRNSFDSLVERDYYVEAEVPDQLRTRDELLQLIKTFCREWQRSAEITLYGREGLHRAIGELKLSLRNAQ